MILLSPRAILLYLEMRELVFLLMLLRTRLTLNRKCGRVDEVQKVVVLIKFINSSPSPTHSSSATLLNTHNFGIIKIFN